MKSASIAGRRNAMVGSSPAQVVRTLLLAASLTFAFAGAAWAETPDASLDRLEQKFFQHTYPKETESQRIERLEKMVFGDAKQGSEDQRLSSLVQLVPQSDQGGDAPPPPTAENNAPERQAPATASAPAKSQPRKTASRAPAEDYSEPPTKSDPGNYPAVTAIEQKVLGRDYPNEPVESRLARLETKVFGKPSKSNDLSDRVDALKERSGIDIAARPPGGGSDWMDDDDDDMTMPPGRSMPPRRAAPAAQAGEDGQEWGRNIKNDIRNAFNSNPSTGGATGSGIGSNWAPSADEPDPDFDDFTARHSRSPSVAGRSPASSAPTTVAPAGMGLTQQVASLETSVLGKTYVTDSLPKRISRLEIAVFPSDKTLATKSLPERVHNLVATIGVTVPQPAPSRKVAQRGQDPDFADLDNRLPPTAPSRSGLSSLVNQLGNMMNQNNFVGGYPVSGSLVRDPGNPSLMMDPMTGNLINPVNGMIVGKRVMQPMPGMPAMPGAYPYGGMAPAIPSFGSGFSPIGGMQFGAGGARGTMWP